MSLWVRLRKGFVAGLSAAVLVVGLNVVVAPTAHAATPVYPDLRMAKLRGFTIGSDPSLPGHRLLRFTTIIVNTGASGGTFEVLGSRPDTSQTTMSVTQVIHNSDGTTTRVGVPGAVMVFDTGDGHHHWHLRGLERATLKTPSGATLRSAKRGYCFYDNVAFNLSLPGAPQSPVFTGCGTTSSLTVDTGLSVGWGDEYPARVFGQWIDITGEPNGQYHLAVAADPNNYFAEANNSNNSTWVDLSIQNDTIKVLRFGPYA